MNQSNNFHTDISHFLFIIAENEKLYIFGNKISSRTVDFCNNHHTAWSTQSKTDGKKGNELYLDRKIHSRR